MKHTILKRPATRTFWFGLAISLIGLGLGLLEITTGIWPNAYLPFLILALPVLTYWAGMSHADRAIYHEMHPNDYET